MLITSGGHKVRILSLSKDMIEKLTKKYPFYTQITVPKGTYAGFGEDATTVAVQAMLVCNDKVKDDLAYDITKSIFTNLDKLKAAHSVGKLISKEAAQKGLPIAVSAGAEKFYKEK